MLLIDALRRQAKDVENGFEKAKAFAQKGNIGAFRESVIRDFLRPFLPARYGLGTGEVFSRDDEQSRQIDVVIFDSVFSPVLFPNDPVSLYPAESVYGAIEVKSNLTAAELEAACANAASLKSLRRAPSTMLDFLPTFRLNLGRGLHADGPCRNPYICTVLGYNGIKGSTITEHLNNACASRPTEKQLLPDFIFVADPGYMVIRTDEVGHVVPLGQDFARYRLVRTATDTLVLMFLTLNVLLSNILLHQPSYIDYWTRLADESLARQQGD